MFFGWDRVSKKFHLLSTWLVAIGSNLSALWILVANGWMQNPVGMQFNPDTARFEMQNFWEVLFSPVAMHKFTHATSSGFLLASLVVVGISSWYLLKGRHIEMAKKSIIVAAVFGLLSSLYVGFTGDEAAFTNARVQPMKLAAFEGLYDGQKNAGLVAMGIMNPAKQTGDSNDPFLLEVRVPGLLSLLAKRKMDTFVPGINDLVYGNTDENIMGVQEKINRGSIAIEQLGLYKNAKKNNNPAAAARALAQFSKHREYLGYGHLFKPEDAVPPVALTFYSFHIMVILGGLFILVFLAFLFYAYKGTLAENKWLHLVGIISIPLGYIAQQTGWIVAEVGRQPWAIQGLLPVTIARSNLTAGTVQTTFFLFLILFTALLIAEIKIILKQIKIGPEGA
jgi:cytochrome d ubiquinol oxidase subunit I